MEMINDDQRLRRGVAFSHFEFSILFLFLTMEEEVAEAGPLCIYEKRDPHIAIIKLNRPEKKNAISRDLYWALDNVGKKLKPTTMSGRFS